MFGFAFRTYDKKMKLSNCQQIKLTISCTCVCLSIFSVLRFLCFFFSFYFSNIAPCQFLDPRTQKCWEQASKKKISSQVWFQLQRNSIIDWNSKNLKKCELEGDRKKTQIFWIHFFKWNFAAFFFSIQFLSRDIYSRKIFNQILNRMQGINVFNAFFSWWCFFIQKAFLRNTYALIWNIQTFNRLQNFLLHCCALSLKFNWMKFTWVFSNWTLSCNNSEIVSESAII